jgi:hypothetical protein
LHILIFQDGPEQIKAQRDKGAHESTDMTGGIFLETAGGTKHIQLSICSVHE